MRQSGIKWFLTQKLSWNLINKFPHTSFNWKGLDGSVVTAHFPPADTYNSNARLEDIMKSVDKNK
jgi:alpha-mannosidase